MNHRARHLIENHISKSSRRTYEVGCKKFITFCQLHRYQLIPPSVTVIPNFISNLFASQISLSTARVYLAGVANFYSERGMDNPLQNDIVRQAMKGYARLRAQKMDNRRPITLTMMRHFKSRLLSSTYSMYDKLLFWCSFTMAFFGFLRISEVTEDGRKAIVLNHISASGKKHPTAAAIF